MMLFFQLHIYTSAVANGLASIINVVVAIWIAAMINKGKFDRMGNKINAEETKEENKEETIEEQ